MATTSTYAQYEFDLVTEQGYLIAECVEFRGNITGSYAAPERDVGFPGGFEDLDFSDIEIRTTKPNETGRSFYKGEDVWIKLPDDMKPYFVRWFESDNMRETINEWLDTERRDYNDSDDRYDEWRDRRNGI